MILRKKIKPLKKLPRKNYNKSYQNAQQMKKGKTCKNERRELLKLPSI